MSFSSDRDIHHQPGQIKKLRFITNQGAPHPKRRRITAACLTCRRRKIACSGEKPTCATCVSNKVECSGYGKASTEHDQQGKKVTATDGSSGGPSDTPGVREQHGSLLSQISVAQSRSEQKTADSQFDRKASQISPTTLQATRNRMPYFRWLGPTAIMPGFKQMVVKVNRHGTGPPSSTEESAMSPSMNDFIMGGKQKAGSFSSAPKPMESDVRTPLSLPFYDTSTMPPSELITHLCETFFIHLGCNFPFLQKERFLVDLAAKQVDAILVDAVCAMAARFSQHTLLIQQTDDGSKASPSDYGRAFAERAKTALVDTYAVPSVAAVQAALLLAYNEFGESRDSGLWMLLGVAIRMAQDLGLQTMQGLRYEGRIGPTPIGIRLDLEDLKSSPASDGHDEQELRAVERERVDTFWSVFFLDRVVSSGVGRRSTIRDDDIELSFPVVREPHDAEESPSPFPALIRIIHLYGRVADLLNSIKRPADITPETSKRLAEKEAQVTDFYNRLPERLHFEAMNFHRYVKAGEGTNFVLLHFWFHTLVILLHNPTLLKTFEGGMLQLFPNSQQLSMSSAKTIADILSYSQLIDTKASLGNPFTTQPIYIAACAFLKETADRTASSSDPSRVTSRDASSSHTPIKNVGLSSTNPDVPITQAAEDTNSVNTKTSGDKVPSAAALEKSLAKHALLVKQANKDYQLCYQALEAIETYWAGTKYIITVLDQKYKGIGDPLLYTAEEGESSLEQPVPEPSFTSPGWRRKISWAPPVLSRFDRSRALLAGEEAAADPSQAIGWTLTGDLNSTNTNLAWHYPTNPSRRPSEPVQASNHIGGPQYVFPTAESLLNRSASSSALPRPLLSNTQSYQSTFSASSNVDGAAQIDSPYNTSLSGTPPMTFQTPQGTSVLTSNPGFMPSGSGDFNLPFANTSQFGDLVIESQDVDMSMLGMDMLSWLDPPPNTDMLDLFGTSDMSLGAMPPPPTNQDPD